MIICKARSGSIFILNTKTLRYTYRQKSSLYKEIDLHWNLNLDNFFDDEDIYGFII